MTIGPFGHIWRPWVYSAIKELDSKFPTTSAGTYPGHDPSEALAADFMVPHYTTNAGKALGNALAKSIATTTEAKRLGIWYVIFYGRIWSMTRPSRGWLPYFDAKNPNPSRSHKNHVHVSWYNRDPRPVSRVVYVDKLHPGQTASDSVYWVQKALGIPTTSTYDQATIDAVKAFQTAMGDDVIDGDLGPLDTEALFAKHPDLMVTIEAHS